MTNRFLISVATAALIAGTGFANAQGAGGATQGRPAPPAQQSAPPSGGASSGGAMQRDTGGTSGMKGAETGTKGIGAQHEGLGIDRQDGPEQERSGRQPDAGREVQEHALGEPTRPRAARK